MPKRRSRLRTAHRTTIVAALLTLAGASIAAPRTHPVTPHPGTAAPSLSVVALGDSVPSGYGCACTGYVQSLADRITAATGREVLVHNDAEAGATSIDVADAIRNDPVSSDLAASDLVIIQVGANDVDATTITDCEGETDAICEQPALQTLRTELAQIIVTVKAAAHHPIVAVVGYWNITVDGAAGAARGAAFIAASEQATEHVNRVIHDVATENAVVYVDTHTPLKGVTGMRDPTDDLQDDGDHPNANGNEIIAEAAFRALQAAGKGVLSTA